MTDADPLFIDTNILIYANVATVPLHAQALTAIRQAHQAGWTCAGTIMQNFGDCVAISPHL